MHERRERWREWAPLAVCIGLLPRVAAAMQPCHEGTHPSRWGVVIAVVISMLGLAIGASLWRTDESVLVKVLAVLLALVS